MKTKITRLLFLFFAVYSHLTYAQSKGIRYQYANISNLVRPNFDANNSSTFEIGNGDIMVHTPKVVLSGQPNVSYAALSRFGSDLCYKGSKLIPYPSYVSGLFSNAIPKNDGGFAIYTNSKPYIIRNYDNNANLIFEKEITDYNIYGTTMAPQAPKMTVHPITNNLFFAYLEYSPETNANLVGFEGSPIINFIEISNTTGDIVNSFKLQIPYDRQNIWLTTPTITTWVFDSVISDLRYVRGSSSGNDRIWVTLNLRNEGSYPYAGNVVPFNSGGIDVSSIIPTQISGLFPKKVYTAIFSFNPSQAIAPSIGNTLIGLLPSTVSPKMMESGPLVNGFQKMILYATQNQKPVIYKFPYVGFVDPIADSRHEFPYTVINNAGSIKNHLNTILVSFDNSFGIFNENTLQINLRRRTSGVPIFNNSGTVNFHTGNTTSLYLNYNMAIGFGNTTTNMLIKESLSDFPNTCFSTNFATSVATNESVSINHDGVTMGVLESTSDIYSAESNSYAYSEISNNSIMTVYFQCNVKGCAPPPQSRISANFESDSLVVNLSPNPTKSYFDLTSELNIEKVELYSLLGQLVKTFEKQEHYSVFDIAKGTYIVKITSSEGVSNKTLIIE